MNITLEQYNTVVDGLTEAINIRHAEIRELNKDLELQNNITHEQQKIILNQRDQREDLNKQLEQLKSENFNLSKDLNKSVIVYDELKRDFDNLSNAHTMTNEEHSEVVIALKTELDNLKKEYAEYVNKYHD